MITDLKINEADKARYYDPGYWSDQTLCDAWNESVARFADRVYVKDDFGSTLTYRQVDEAAARLAGWLVQSGIENGDVVSFQIPKWSEFCIVYVACLKAGAVMHPLPVNFNGDDLLYVMNHVESSAYILPTFSYKTDYEAQYEAIADNLPSLKAVLLIDKERPPHADSAHPLFSRVVSEHPPLKTPAPSKADEVACILSTSGTTGRPKAALFTHNTILFSERSYLSVLDLTPDDVAWMPSPLNHATGFYHGLISTMLVGASTVLELHFSAKDAVSLINREGCTWSHGATPFIYDLLTYLDAEDEHVPSLRFFLCGGAPVPSSLVQQAFGHGILLCESYGSTESCPHVHVPLNRCIEWNGRYSGIPYEGIEVRVVDENRNEVPRGVQGEECSKGPHQFVGYLNDKERTDRALDDNGWFYSGDLCIMDHAGRIKINGRKKEIIIRGGENISAVEVDNDLTGCPGIGDHATIGMPDERLGERICTFAVPTGDFRPSVEDVKDYLSSKGVQKRLWPERMEYIEEIPHTKTGKVQRYLLAQELERRTKQDAGSDRK